MLGCTGSLQQTYWLAVHPMPRSDKRLKLKRFQELEQQGLDVPVKPGTSGTDRVDTSPAPRFLWTLSWGILLPQ